MINEIELGYRECYAILEEHGKTFHVMAKLLGGDRGKGIAAIYGFARTSDDAVDEPLPGETAADIKRKLQWMSAELRRACQKNSSDRRFAALGETITRYGIDLYPFDDLIAGVLMDLEKSRYDSFPELELYCYRVAGTIGLMITPIAGYEGGAKTLEYAKTLGTAFQLTNILRDVGEDLERGRVYLPKQDLARFGVTEAELFTKANTENFRDLMRFEIDRAFAFYQQGQALIPLVKSWTGALAFQFAIDAYSGILNKIRLNRYDVFAKRAHLTFWEKIFMLPRSVWHVAKARWQKRGGTV